LITIDSLVAPQRAAFIRRSGILPLSMLGTGVLKRLEFWM
jgi:hypothetical protein